MHDGVHHPRQQELLKTLLFREEGWMTSAQLAAVLKISDRTVRSDVTALNTVLQGHEARVIAERGKGYRLEAGNRAELEKRFAALCRAGSSSKEGRMRHILLILLFRADPVDIGEFEDELMVSRSTVEQDIKSIRTMLANFYPALHIYRANGKLGLSRTEFAARLLLGNLLLANYDLPQGKMTGPFYFFRQESFYRAMSIVMECTERKAVYMNDENMAKIAAYLAVSMHRIREGRCIATLDCAKSHLDETVLEFAEELYHAAIRANMGPMEYDDLEIRQLAIQLSFINLFQSPGLTKNQLISESSPQVITIVEALLTNIKKDYNLDLCEDEALFVNLTLHLKALINRVQYHQVELNPILNIMKNEYPFIFELSLHVYELFHTHLQLKLTESEVSYVAAHLAAAMERMGYSYGDTRLRVALICHLGAGYSTLLMSKLKAMYGASIEILGPYPACRTDKCLAENPDIILSTTPLQKKTDTPLHIINPRFSKSDQQHFDTMAQTARRKALHGSPAFSRESIVAKFDPAFFHPGLDMNSSREVIAFMCGEMERAGAAPEQFGPLTLEREAIASTLLSNHIAIPHPMSACAHRTAISVAILDKSIAWGEYRAQLIFLIGVRPGEKEYLKDFFDLISALMDDDKAVQEILAARDFDAFLKAIRKVNKWEEA